MRKKSLSERLNLRWVIFITIWTFILAGVFTIISNRLVEKLNVVSSFIVLFMFVFIGIIFDVIGIAVTTAEEKPFHAMAANKVIEAKYAIRLVRNASQVSNFCNDVIGDISGIISGAIGTNIVFNIIKNYNLPNGVLLSLVLTSFIAAFTVGGKAIGKAVAMESYEEILTFIAKILYILDSKFGIKIIKED